MVLLKFFHVLFIFLWIGSLLTVTGFMAHQKESSKELSRLLKRIYLSVELPSMCLAILFGVVLLFTKTDINFKAPWLHIKLTFAFLLIVCDIICGALVGHLQQRAACAGKIGHLFLHYLSLLFLVAVLLAIYYLKPQMT